MRSSDFQTWLSQLVYVNSSSVMPRRKIIPAFADELVAMLQKKGYIMCDEWGSGHMIVARWLYRIQKDHVRGLGGQIIYPVPYHRAWPEDYDEFQHVIDTATVFEFMESWALCDDFSPETRVGERVIHELQQLLYPYLNLEDSRNGMIVADSLMDSDSDSDSCRKARPAVRKVDNYIADAQEGYHGGNWSKV